MEFTKARTPYLADLPPEMALLAATLRQAVVDAQQNRDEKLRQEANEFLQRVAPSVAARLKE